MSYCRMRHSWSNKFAEAEMQRRSLLKGIAASFLQSVLWRRLPLQAAARLFVARRVRPSDPLWPSAASWKKLKAYAGGNLIEVRSLFAACETEPKGGSCLEAVNNMHNPYYIGDQPAGTQVSGWLNAWTPAPSAYAVAARSTADVVAAVDFARKNNLRLVVKGGGHSYQGTSNAADSLLIWTRAMNKVTLHDAFVGKGCDAGYAPVPAVTAEAGAVWMDLYTAVTTKAGRYVQGGGCTTVGVAGLVQSGGFGSFSKGFGTAASGLLEAEVVTADGSVRTANACTNPDLFWAIKGGGGGSWGLVTKVTLRTRDLPEFFGWALGKIKARSDPEFHRLIDRFVSFYGDNLFNPHWGESVKIGPDNTLEVSMVSQGVDSQQAKQVWQPFFNWVAASGSDFVASELNAGAMKAQHWWDVEYRKSKGDSALISDPRAGVPAFHAWWNGDQAQVGFFIHGFDSAWLPASLLRKEQQYRLSDALFSSSRHKKVELHFNKGLAGAPAEAIAAARNTATNPAVADAFALAIIAGGSAPAYPGFPHPALDPAAARGNAHKIDQAMEELLKIAPDGGSYVSESNYFNSTWQHAFWGQNYPRLRIIKAKYDPDGLFFVHHGVGTEDWSEDGFTRLKKR
jgi:FAD/FMN-containing dehydrogenase